jgi:hypothetical protein
MKICLKFKAMLKPMLATGLIAASFLSVLGLPKLTSAQNPKPVIKVSADEARKRIQEHKALIDTRVKAMSDLYYAGNAVQTLKAAFQKQGVSARRDPQNWGMNGLSSGWLDAKFFYEAHSVALRDSLSAMGQLAYVNESNLAYLDQGMQAWKEYEQQLQNLFQEAVAVYTRSAVNYDKQDAITEAVEKQRAEAKQRGLDVWYRVYEATKVQVTEALKPLQLEAKQIDEAYNQVWKNINEISNKRLFEAIKAWGTEKEKHPTYLVSALSVEDLARKRLKMRLRFKKESLEDKIEAAKNDLLAAQKNFVRSRDAAYQLSQQLDAARIAYVKKIAELQRKRATSSPAAVLAAIEKDIQSIDARVTNLSSQQTSALAKQNADGAIYLQSQNAVLQAKRALSTFLQSPDNQAPTSTVQTITMTVNGQPVYVARYDSRLKEVVDKLNEQIAIQEQTVAGLDSTRRVARTNFLALQHQSIEALTELEEEIRRARIQTAFIDATLYLKDVGIGAAKGGPVGALVAGVIYLAKEKAFESSGDEQSPEAQSNKLLEKAFEQSLYAPPDFATNEQIGERLLAERVTDTLVTKPAVFITPILAEGTTNFGKELLRTISGADALTPESLKFVVRGVATQKRAFFYLEAAEKKIDQLGNAANRALNTPGGLKQLLGTAAKNQLGELGYNLAADAVGIGAKEYLKYRELMANANYVVKESIARLAYRPYATKNDLYWQAREDLENLIEARNILLEKDDSGKNFIPETNLPWIADQPMVITLTPEPGGDFNSVRVGGVAAIPQKGYSFSLRPADKDLSYTKAGPDGRHRGVVLELVF